MNKQPGCFYCEQDDDFCKVLYKICDLRVSTVFLCRDQTLPGRCTIMYREHVEELFEIPKADRDAFMDDVCTLASTIQTLFSPDKINYAIYGDGVKHVHFTICPKYRGKLGFGGPFVLFPEEKDLVCLSDAGYAERIALMKEKLLESI